MINSFTHDKSLEKIDAEKDYSDLFLLLTEREVQIIRLVALGQQNKQIAKHLGISKWTVSTHLRRIFAKLHVDSRASMVYRCSNLIKR